MERWPRGGKDVFIIVLEKKYITTGGQRCMLYGLLLLLLLYTVK